MSESSENAVLEAHSSVRN